VVTKPKQIRSFHLKAADPLLTRTAAFLTVFIVFSGIIGPRIISHGLVNKDGFQVYGGAGKALLFGAIAFLLLVQRSSSSLKLKKWQWRDNAVWLFIAVLALAGAWLGVSKLLSGDHGTSWVFLVHTCLLASIVFAAGGTLGPANLRLLARTYKKQILVSISLTILFYVFLMAVYGLWKFLAAIVLHSVSWLLNSVGIKASIIPPRTLILKKFGINVAQYCSGIESIGLFTAFYALIGVLDWQRFNHRRYLWVFPFGLLLLFGFNILRVFVLILGGYYINPQIAFSLFHTYAGMALFIIYSTIFWAIAYKRLLATTPGSRKKAKA
jgi:exosortase/archaeosortase family protein